LQACAAVWRIWRLDQTTHICSTLHRGNCPMNAPSSHSDDSTVPTHQTKELMAGGKVALIEHQGQTYTLRITRAGKLILTK